MSGVSTPGIILPASLRIVTSVIAPVVAVTSTGPAGLMWSEPGSGATDNTAGLGTAGRDADTSRGAAATGQVSGQWGALLTTTPPSTASTARTPASQAPRRRRENVNQAPVWSASARDSIGLADRYHCMVGGPGTR